MSDTKTTRIAINGFGRVGRSFFKVAFKHPGLDIVAVNDLGDIDNLAYLLQYDTVYGRSLCSVSVEKEGVPALIVDGKKVRVLSEADPGKLPWKELGVDLVVESTGLFTSYAKADAHRTAGARRVVVTAPMKDEPPEGITGATVLMGVNNEKLAVCDISSNASCTTNAGSPLMQILHEGIGVEKAVLNTTHAYTASQSIVDGPVKKGKKHFRDGRAAAANIIPSSTGAAIAVTKALPALEGKFDGIALRVPVAAGSIVDVTFVASRATSIEEVNSILKKAAGEDRWKSIFAVTEEQLVSSDILGQPYASIADLSLTRVVDGNLVKVLAWYDNEMGYAYSLLEHVLLSARYLS